MWCEVYFKVIVAGGRDFKNYNLLEKKLDVLLSNKVSDHTIVIVSGGANGADKLGERYAKKRNYKVDKFPADWDKYGKRAGYLRNEEMAKHGDVLVAFWDGVSRGTGHMINIMKRLNKPVKIVRY